MHMVTDEDVKNWFMENFGFIPDKREFPTFWEETRKYLQFLEDIDRCVVIVMSGKGYYVEKEDGTIIEREGW